MATPTPAMWAALPVPPSSRISLYAPDRVNAGLSNLDGSGFEVVFFDRTLDNGIFKVEVF
jgi:hypothetical protein